MAIERPTALQTQRVPVRPVRVYALCTCGQRLRSTGEGRSGVFGSHWVHACPAGCPPVELPKTSPWLEYDEIPGD